MNLAQNMREARKRAGKSQAEIAALLDTQRTNYIRYENGERDLPIKHLVTLAKFYGMTLDELVGMDD